MTSLPLDWIHSVFFSVLCLQIFSCWKISHHNSGSRAYWIWKWAPGSTVTMRRPKSATNKWRNVRPAHPARWAFDCAACRCIKQTLNTIWNVINTGDANWTRTASRRRYSISSTTASACEQRLFVKWCRNWTNCDVSSNDNQATDSIHGECPFNSESGTVNPN